MTNQIEIRNVGGKTSVLLDGKEISSMLTGLVIEMKPAEPPKIALTLMPGIRGEVTVRIDGDVLGKKVTKELVDIQDISI